MRTLMVMAAALLLAGCASVHAAHPRNLVQAAHELDESARWLARSFDRHGGHYRGHDHREHAADNLARSARHFHRNVEQGRSLAHLRRDFEAVERDYYDLRSQLGHGHGYRGHNDPVAVLGALLSDVKRSLYYQQRRYRYDDRYDRYGRNYRSGNGWSFSFRF